MGSALVLQDGGNGKRFGSGRTIVVVDGRRIVTNSTLVGPTGPPGRPRQLALPR